MGGVRCGDGARQAQRRGRKERKERKRLGSRVGAARAQHNWTEYVRSGGNYFKFESNETKETTKRVVWMRGERERRKKQAKK